MGPAKMFVPMANTRGVLRPDHMEGSSNTGRQPHTSIIFPALSVVTFSDLKETLNMF